MAPRNDPSTSCLLCDAPIYPVMSFGRMPLANGFLSKEEFPQEFFFNLDLGFCLSFSLLQLLDQPARETMFHSRYPFFSGSSSAMQRHFKIFAGEVLSRLSRFPKADNPFVIEIGSNDGSLLGHFARAGIRHLGLEPSENVARRALANGISTQIGFFDEAPASSIESEYGQADVILAANVMCHIPYLHAVFKGAAKLLKRDGLFIFEDPYLGDVLEKISYDQIYDEHVFLFSAAAITSLARRHGLEVIDVQPQKTHGGSMRFTVGHAGRHSASTSVEKLLEQERKRGLQKPETYVKFRESCEKSRGQLCALLQDLHRRHKRTVGYAATSKSTTVIQYCRITQELLEFICDTTPAKQGKFSPGAHIPIVPISKFSSPYPDHAVLFAWNHQTEIMEKERAFLKAGGKWIVYVPDVRILQGD